MLVHASIDENGKISNGAAGDQTGREVCTRTFYTKPWNVMLRYKDSSIAAKASEIGVKLANSNLVGYDQNQRNTLYTQLKKNNFDVDKYIKGKVKTETDCSAFQYAIYCCLIPEMRQDGNAPTTSTMRTFFSKHGFTAYTDSKYLISDDYLKKGDILVAEGHHTVQNITNGSKVSTTSKTTSSTTYTRKKFIKDIQSAIGVASDGAVTDTLLEKLVTVSKTKNSKHPLVKPIQKYLSSLGYSVGTVDGVYGEKTYNAVIKYQTANKLTADGIVGKNTWKKLVQ